MIGLIASVVLFLQSAGPAPDQRVPPPPPPMYDCWPGPWIVFFEKDQARLGEEARAILDGVLKTQRGLCGGFSIALKGHADGGERQGIAGRRAGSVRGYLRRRGMAPRTLSVEDLGSRFPRVPIRPGVSDIQNRRVELLVGARAASAGDTTRQ